MLAILASISFVWTKPIRVNAQDSTSLEAKPVESFWSWVVADAKDATLPDVEYRIVKGSNDEITAILAQFPLAASSGVAVGGQQSPRRIVMLWSRDTIRAYVYKPQCFDLGGASTGTVRTPGQGSVDRRLDSAKLTCVVTDVSPIQTLEVLVAGKTFTLNRVDSTNQNTSRSSLSNSVLSSALRTFSFSDSASYSSITRKNFEAVRKQVRETELLGVFPVDSNLVQALKKVKSNSVIQIGGRSVAAPPVVLRLPNRNTAGIDISTVKLLQEMY